MPEDKGVFKSSAQKEKEKITNNKGNTMIDRGSAPEKGLKVTDAAVNGG